ncbi:MAG TPA: hypothetical protein VLI94_13935 [Solirubrobacterales bacterium]|nr:hypothetical protein [Solirubrobacterales bacterium]
MIRKFKALGLAMVAVLALSAIGVSTAQAQFTASSYPATVTATSELGNDVITTEGGSVECKSQFEGTLTEASNTLTVTPTYTNCKAFGFTSATVNMNGCKYEWKRFGFLSFGVEITCPLNKTMTIVAGNCEIDFPPQSGLLNGTIANKALDLDFRLNLSKITYNVTKDGFLCPFGGTGHKTGASYVQSVAVTLTAGGPTISFD